MNKKTLIPTILFIGVLVFAVVVLINNNKKQSTATSINPAPLGSSQNEIILFYGDNCPHCAIVDKYLKDNNIKNKVNFTEKEIYRNKANSSELTAKAEVCGLPTNSIGVPFLWDGENCLIGDKDIIEFFKQKTNEQ